METNPMELKPYELCSLSESLNGMVHVVCHKIHFSETFQNGHLCLVAL